MDKVIKIRLLVILSLLGFLRWELETIPSKAGNFEGLHGDVKAGMKSVGGLLLANKEATRSEVAAASNVPPSEVATWEV